MGPKPSAEYSIDRIDNDGDYSPENCRWATPFEQANNKRTSRYLVFNGERKTVTEWGKDLGIRAATIFDRLSRGWSAEKALTVQPAGCSTHGCSAGRGTLEYRAWQKMKAKCYTRKTRGYSYCGGRGIKVCDKWKDDFEAFLEDMGPRPSTDHVMDRRDRDKDYSPDNCRWYTLAEQREAHRYPSNTNLISFNGQTMSQGEWARSLGCNEKLIGHRLNRLGWSVERTLTTPVRKRGTEKR